MALRVLGRHLFEVIAPELAERFTMWEDDEGTCHGRFRIPTAQGQMLTKMILAISSPTHCAQAGGIDPELPTPVCHGLAFTQLIESVPAEALPKTGGCSATVVVTMTLEQLLADLDAAGVCTLDTGGRISVAEARRLACSAGIIPLVLGGKSQVLDVGRKRRLHSEAMRQAMGVRDAGCTEEHGEAPPGLCHAHHDIPWSEGGPTNVDSGRRLCPHHHRRIHDRRIHDRRIHDRRIHDPAYQTTRLPSGKIRFHRRE